MDVIEYKRHVDHFEYNSKISTKYLSHFTPKFDTLLKIVDNGFMPKECDEFQIYKQDYQEIEILSNFYSMLAGGIENVDSLIHQVPMSCFCDIPHKIASRHRRVYGKYCFIMTKEWAISKGFSPLIYVPKDSKIHFLLKSIGSIKDRLVQINQDEGFNIPAVTQLNQQLNLLFEFIKPYINKSDNYKYYDEREWRYTPPAKIPFDSLDTTQYVKFGKNDFCFAIVQNAKEKSILLERLRDKFGYISSKRIKIKKI